ncbi:hypothetical protein D3C81_2016100 [compost metagenome]
MPRVMMARSASRFHGMPQFRRIQWLNCSVLLKISPGAMLMPCCRARTCRSLVLTLAGRLIQRMKPPFGRVIWVPSGKYCCTPSWKAVRFFRYSWRI